MKKLFVHGSYVGDTGYNQHTRDFFRHLSKHSKIKVRNFTVGSTWDGISPEPHNNEPYFNDTDRKLLYEQVLWNADKSRGNYKIYEDHSKDFIPDVNIILCETNHHLFYDEYHGPKIAYNVWESTLQPEGYFEKLKEFDELWVPSKWQRDCTIDQGYDPNKIKVVPEGVDVNTFYPEETSHELTSDGRFKFFLAGRWDYRKSIKEIIETFLKTFDKDEPVDLIISVDNSFSGDGMKSTEERLEHYGLIDDRIKILHFPPREEYIRLLKSCDAFVSCARSEGWNLPLIESMACGIPSIYSNCSGQLEFAKGRGIPVKIVGEKPVNSIDYNHFNGSVGNYYEPDFNDLGKQMLEVVTNHKVYKQKALDESEEIRKEFNWERVAEIGMETINEFLKNYVKPQTNNSTHVSYINGPRVEIKGDVKENYFIEFIDGEGKVRYSDTIYNNMWTSCGMEYYIPWSIKINGEVVNKFNIKDKRVYISFESKSLGDTMAWIPYCEVFRKKHGCQLIVSTFLNSLFRDQYPNIKFIEPGELVPNIHAQYRLGWFYGEDGKFNPNKNPFDFKKIPLQKTTTDILGLDYEEVRPLLKLPNTPKKKKVGIGFHSTAQAKYWNNPDAWQSVIDHLSALGYECMIYSKEGDGYMGNHYPKGVTIYKGGNLQQVINDLSSCEFFIGLGSGLSWLAWACKLPVVLISGFSKKWAETKLDTYRIINESVCHGCFNSERLDAGDWNWCPLHKNTDRMFECTKEINSNMVIKEINKIINNESIEEKIDEVLFDWGEKSEWYVDAAKKEIFEDNTYERFFEVEEGDIVVDLGASLGPFTYKILPKNPKQCYVVEPLSYHIDVLYKNVGRDNVKIIQGAITDKKKINITWDDISESVPTFTFKEFLDENNIKHIDFLKCDCEGGEYDVFQQSNIEFLKTIPKIVTEFHLRDDENFHKCKFRWFRDNIFPQFDNIQVFSFDGVDIKWDLWNEHFIEYYNEVIIYMDNR